MGQLKDMTAAVGKHLFWIVCATITLVALVTWYMATGSTRTETTEREGTVKSTFDTAEGISKVGITIEGSQPHHPNEEIYGNTAKRIDELKVVVSKAWDEQYKDQEAKLQWPEQLFGQSFVRKVKDLRPIELKVPYPVQTEILLEDERAMYRNQASSLLPNLAARIGANWQPSKQGNMSGPGGFGSPPGVGDSDSGTFGSVPDTTAMSTPGSGQQQKVDTSIVLWNAANQGLWEQKFKEFPGTENIPTTLQILYAQEDLWVLEELMNIIAGVNTGAVKRYEATIKEIDHILIGREAQGPMGNITMPGGGSGSGGAPPGGGGIPPGMEEMMATGAIPGVSGAGGGDDPPSGGPGGAYPGVDSSGGSGGTSGTTALAASPDPAHGRYVDKNYEPLPADTLRGSFTSTDPEQAYLAVAKRMPIRIGMKIDQRKLNKVLTAFGNSPFSIEIRQIRINRHKNNSAGGSSMMGGGGSPPGFGGGESSSFMGVPGGDSFGGGLTGGSVYGGGSSSTVSSESPYDINVELFGIMYIYNPVATDVLEVEGTSDDAVATPGTAPAGEATPATSAG